MSDYKSDYIPCKKCGEDCPTIKKEGQLYVGELCAELIGRIIWGIQCQAKE